MPAQRPRSSALAGSLARRSDGFCLHIGSFAIRTPVPSEPAPRFGTYVRFDDPPDSRSAAPRRGPPQGVRAPRGPCSRTDGARPRRGAPPRRSDDARSTRSHDRSAPRRSRVALSRASPAAAQPRRALGCASPWVSRTRPAAMPHARLAVTAPGSGGDTRAARRRFVGGREPARPSTVPGDEDLVYLWVRRPLIEWALRRAACAEPGVQVGAGSTIAGVLKDSAGRAEGVALDGGEALRADVVVDARGRYGTSALAARRCRADGLRRDPHSRYFQLRDALSIRAARCDEDDDRAGAVVAAERVEPHVSQVAHAPARTMVTLASAT